MIFTENRYPLFGIMRWLGFYRMKNPLVMPRAGKAWEAPQIMR
jgi:hypothetical protein